MNAFSFLLVLFAVLASVSWLFILFRRPKDEQEVTDWKMTSLTSPSSIEWLSKLGEENCIGSGGSGKVYRVHLNSREARQVLGHGDKAAKDQTTVAVKQFSGLRSSIQIEKEFEAEVSTLSCLRHRNIVKLHSCVSSKRGMKLLIYGYMENGSLDQWLHNRVGQGERGLLDWWPTRLSIAIDAAKGLCYMHHDSTRPVIHRDVKSSNILLDNEFKGKIGDFGLARILTKVDESELASAICGTFGYMAPEYARRGKVSTKVDVYSFGVVLLELTTGKRPQDSGSQLGTTLAIWAQHQYDNNSFRDFIDKKIQHPEHINDVLDVFKLGLICTVDDPLSRPKMDEVLERLLQYDRRRVKILDKKILPESTARKQQSAKYTASHALIGATANVAEAKGRPRTCCGEEDTRPRRSGGDRRRLHQAGDGRHHRMA